MPIMHVIRGLPGAGKSTYARNLGCLVIEPEDHYSMVDGVYDWANRCSVDTQKPYLMAKDLIEIASKHYVDIAIAEVLPTRQSVQDLLDLVPTYEHRVITLSISVKESFRLNSHKVGITTILQMQSRWELFPGEFCFTHTHWSDKK